MKVLSEIGRLLIAGLIGEFLTQKANTEEDWSFPVIPTGRYKYWEDFTREMARFILEGIKQFEKNRIKTYGGRRKDCRQISIKVRARKGNMVVIYRNKKDWPGRRVEGVFDPTTCDITWVVPRG